ncbi:hypothetical protein Vretimale_14252 [Volvox reticuliferus]|uniref:Uncharacterized protein n=1 Tax=Volvox reticuliferus TaxID=1737510 RepID=A0A8J4CP30_9CHLO|nr:hypothetical protein Vretifemale_15250 [Volvox reticuliferus]GIM10657.1 hypothetical protein Vretimale_14252 [Volvox reticuliferus]
MDEGKVDPTALPPPTIKTRDSQGSPLAILAIALASGIGYVSWKWWKRWQGEKKYREFSPTGQESTAKSRSTCFAFDKQPISALSTSGRPASSNSTRRPSRIPSQRARSSCVSRPRRRRASKLCRMRRVVLSPRPLLSALRSWAWATSRPSYQSSTT